MYSNKKVKPGQKKFMCLDEFIEIFRKSSLILEGRINEKDLSIAYCLSMQVILIY